MKTFAACVPCFFKQAVKLAGLSGADEKQTREIIDALSRRIPEFDFTLSPPELSRIIYSLAAEITGVADPYAGTKKKSNALALEVMPAARRKLDISEDRLLTAVELAIAGNIIDYGIGEPVDAEVRISQLIRSDATGIQRDDTRIFDYLRFRSVLADSQRILYLADNAGEIVFDRILMEEIKSLYQGKKIFCAVKEKPIINDALIDDAIDCGMNEFAEVFSSGSDAPGTVISLCSNEFRRKLDSADMVISKGQGNFEAFIAEGKPTFYLFMAKCEVVAREAGCRPGDTNLLSRGA